MAVMEASLPQLKTGGNDVEKLSIAEIERRLGIDKSKIRAIHATPSDTSEFEDKGDIFREWYEEELRAFYDED